MSVVEQARIPFFSIVIPVYNREREIVRALQSCLSQSFANLEVIVVDDASQDHTGEAVERLGDPRVLLLRHEKNRGVCPARNTGISHSCGEWVLFLDSDDELMPEGLKLIAAYAAVCPEDIDRLGFLYRRDNGRLSPEPTPPDCVLDYEDYIAWSARLSPSDFFHCTRRRAFAKVMFSESRAYEISYLLDFAKQYRTRMIPEVVALIHTDSANRDNNLSDQELIDKFLRDAPDEAAAMEHILYHHGPALLKNAGNRYQICRKAQVLFCFLSGRRWQGSRLAVKYLSRYPLAMEGWVIWLAGLVGPRTLARVKIWKMKALSEKREKNVRQVEADEHRAYCRQ